MVTPSVTDIMHLVNDENQIILMDGSQESCKRRLTSVIDAFGKV
jgi:putative N-acetylmannosamine-6-phosphate epimerase